MYHPSIDPSTHRPIHPSTHPSCFIYYPHVDVQWVIRDVSSQCFSELVVLHVLAKYLRPENRKKTRLVHAKKNKKQKNSTTQHVQGVDGVSASTSHHITLHHTQTHTNTRSFNLQYFVVRDTHSVIADHQHIAHSTNDGGNQSVIGNCRHRTHRTTRYAAYIHTCGYARTHTYNIYLQTYIYTCI